MRHFGFPTFFLVFLLAGCGKAPDTYTPPIQRKPLIGSEFGLLGHFFLTGDPDADVHIVGGVHTGDPVGNWRWTQQTVELRFLLPASEHMKFTMDFAIPEEIFPGTGPWTLTYFVNGNQLDRVRYDKPREQHFEKAVPPEWLKARAENRVSIESDRVWVAGDGAKMGYLLIRAGFTQ